MHRFAPENDHHACKSGKRDGDLRGCAEDFKFHGNFRFSAKCDVMRRKALPLFELALVLVRFDHVAGIVRSEGSFKSCSTNASTSLLIRSSSSFSAPKISSTRSGASCAF